MFPNEANYNAILAPLMEFGSYHGCYGIAYKTKHGYHPIPLQAAAQYQEAQLLFCLDPNEFLDLYDLWDLTEADADQLINYMDYVMKP